MIESNNPEIDVTELMERVRREAAKVVPQTDRQRYLRPRDRRIVLPEIAEISPLPSLALSPPLESQFELMEKLLKKTRRKIYVSSWIPRIFRRFFQRQGGFNRGVLETVSCLVARNEQLGNQVRELRAAVQAQNQWLGALAEQRPAEADWKRMAQALIERDGAHLRDLQAQSDGAGEHLRNLQSEWQRATLDLRDLREMLARFEERQLNDAIFLKGALSQQSAVLQHFFSADPDANGAGTRTSQAAEWDAHRLDSFYLSFENRFRGSRQEIKEKVRFYLPFLEETGAGTPNRPIIDLGCGRGEWLELLKENGLEATGLDLNKAMVAECTARNLPVTQGDAVAHLRSLPDDGLGAVTGFHLIEHLPLEVLVDLIAEVRRVLRPGGLAIFETPNCKNLMVGACNFNVDPTHRNPIFPETAEFMLGAQGFEKVRLEYLTPVDVSRLPETKELPPVLRDLLYGPQDFAVIGTKPGSA